MVRKCNQNTSKDKGVLPLKTGVKKRPGAIFHPVGAFYSPGAKKRPGALAWLLDA